MERMKGGLIRIVKGLTETASQLEAIKDEFSRRAAEAAEKSKFSTFMARLCHNFRKLKNLP
jgi:hypothetical protein